MTCVKPFTIPDEWIEKQTPPWDVDDTFDDRRQPRQPVARSRRVHPAPSKPSYTGYNAERDKGMELMIRAGTGNNIMPSFYFSYAIGGVSGGSRVRVEHRQLQHRP